MNGTDLKNSALGTLEATRSEYILRGRRALLQTLLALGNATADDVRDLVPLPTGINPKLFGAVPGALAKAGIVVADGYRPSARSEAHGRPVQVWRLLDRDAARQWLRDNPDPKPATEDERVRQGNLFDLPSGSASVEGW